MLHVKPLDKFVEATITLCGKGLIEPSLNHFLFRASTALIAPTAMRSEARIRREKEGPHMLLSPLQGDNRASSGAEQSVGPCFTPMSEGQGYPRGRDGDAAEHAPDHIMFVHIAWHEVGACLARALIRSL